MIDVSLSVFHFLLVFCLVAILAVQTALVRPGLTSSSLRLAADLDRAYGVIRFTPLAPSCSDSSCPDGTLSP